MTHSIAQLHTLLEALASTLHKPTEAGFSMLPALELLGAQLGATVEPLSPELDPQMLERTLKPIAFTEQAAAVAGRPAEDLTDSDADYRDVVLQGRGYSGTDYIEATYRRALAGRRAH